MEWTLEVDDERGTVAIGRTLGKLLFPGAVIALVGPLGAGKTCLVRAVAEGLEVQDPRVVSSPTFVLIQEYAAGLPIYHFDTYRLHSVADFVDLGVHEYFAGNGVCMVEWADRVADVLPGERLTITIQPTGPSGRRIHFHSTGERHDRLVEGLMQAFKPAVRPATP